METQGWIHEVRQAVIGREKRSPFIEHIVHRQEDIHLVSAVRLDQLTDRGVKYLIASQLRMHKVLGSRGYRRGAQINLAQLLVLQRQSPVLVLVSQERGLTHLGGYAPGRSRRGCELSDGLDRRLIARHVTERHATRQGRNERCQVKCIVELEV